MPGNKGHSLPTRSKQEDTNNIVIKVAEKVGVQIVEENISVSHRLPISKSYKGQGRTTEMAPIIVKFVRHDIKEKFYRARKQLKDLTIRDIGYSATNRIFVSESLTQRKKKELFRKPLYAKKDKGFKFIWTSGKILRKDENSDAIQVSNNDVLQKIQ